MGQATDLSQALTRLPLSNEELAERSGQERRREMVETNLDGEIVERMAPTAAPQPAFQASQQTWD